MFSDKARYNKPITIIVRIFQIIWLTNEATAVNHKLDFSKAFSFEQFEQLSREERCPQSSLFSLKLSKYGSKGRQRFLVQRNPAVLWLMKTCTCRAEITKRGAQSLRMKMRNLHRGCCNYLHHLRLVAACSNLAWISLKVRKTKLVPLVILRAQKRISEQVLHWELVRSLRWDDRRTSVITTPHVSVCLSNWPF